MLFVHFYNLPSIINKTVNYTVEYLTNEINYKLNDAHSPTLE